MTRRSPTPRSATPRSAASASSPLTAPLSPILDVGRTGSDAHAPLVLSLSDIGIADADTVGVKCAALGEVMALGIETPAGFAVTSHVLDRFLTNLPGPVAGTALEETTLPHPLANAVRSAYARLSLDVVGGTGDAAVALRPSPRAAFDAPPIGRPHDAWLNVRGADGVVGTLQRCWASRADAGPFAVAVQQMLECEAAGVALPNDPRTGDTDVVTVQASWGFGLGPGNNPPGARGDQFFVEKSTGAVLSRDIAAKPVQVDVTATGASELRPVPSHRRDAPCLTDEEASRLAEITNRIGRHFGAPQEVEFAVVWRGSGRRLAVLQVKPSTPAPRERGRPPRPKSASGPGHSPVA